MTDQHELRSGTSGWNYDHWRGVFYNDAHGYAVKNARTLQELDAR